MYTVSVIRHTTANSSHFLSATRFTINYNLLTALVVYLRSVREFITLSSCHQNLSDFYYIQKSLQSHCIVRQSHSLSAKRLILFALRQKSVKNWCYNAQKNKSFPFGCQFLESKEYTKSFNAVCAMRKYLSKTVTYTWGTTGVFFFSEKFCKFH